MAQRNKGNNLLSAVHKPTKWCSKPPFLCKNPQHWTWIREIDRWCVDSRDCIDIRPPNIPSVYRDKTLLNVVESMTIIVEATVLLHDSHALKALGILAWNNKEYAEFKAAVLNLYPIIINKCQT